MRVYFIRHAIAAPSGAPGVLDDASRGLTQEGIAKMRQQAASLARMDERLDRIWTSPYLRAQHTAEIVAQAFDKAPQPRELKALAPGGSYEAIFEELAANAKLKAVAMVGHEPVLSETICRLLTGTTHSFIELKKGSIACVEIENFGPPCSAMLRWLLTPRQLRNLRGN
ncbi:MAG: phosphohistidine phosphatase SixA [Phycisphaerae bacterium]|nr:phosphohistidine phosphatase SixA [Phycisphaerae bacterium]